MIIGQGGFLLVLAVLGYLDLRDKQVPVWAVMALVVSCIGLIWQHPLQSLLSTLLLSFLMLFMKRVVGTADKWVLPMVAAALPVVAWLLVIVTYILSYVHIKLFRTNAPMLFYLCVAMLIFVVTGGKWL
ncbi:hypothetical protein RB620_24715 [Paenibacillus sp. LHD-117]|uniref:hypothetical protein n=1 Tax=Paenibacillus sp. LHD-117 TaxID=3071412 RepID=UPI0027DF65EB|nr:hypothetical protein [Paenibacillus sp. LHD-117]MDQ6422640.1 hypothetical protein [Paenibacillus sp. LHD-117]